MFSGMGIATNVLMVFWPADGFNGGSFAQRLYLNVDTDYFITCFQEFATQKPMTTDKKDKKMALHGTWGENLDIEAVRQMDDACSLPISIRGALMPDAHTGYGLPIGGVPAVDNAVIPYAVGVDIGGNILLQTMILSIKGY